MQEIIKREGFYMDAPAIEKLATSTRSDIRQMLNMLQMWCKKGKGREGMTFDEVQSKMADAVKDFDTSIFEVCACVYIYRHVHIYMYAYMFIYT